LENDLFEAAPLGNWHQVSQVRAADFN